ncbi:MAG: AMP-binding protein [Streptosporangiaceae bacterium]
MSGSVLALPPYSARHAQANPDKTAIVFVPELESDDHVEIRYSELHRRVNDEFAAVLRDSLGLQAGDRLTLHMPMVPELPVTMLACARLGVIHSRVFGGFSGAACGHRSADYRSGQLTDHKVEADEALTAARQEDQESTRCWSGGAGPASTPQSLPWSTAGTCSSTSCSPTMPARRSSRCRCLPGRRCS